MNLYGNMGTWYDLAVRRGGSTQPRGNAAVFTHSADAEPNVKGMQTAQSLERNGDKTSLLARQELKDEFCVSQPTLNAIGKGDMVCQTEFQ